MDKVSVDKIMRSFFGKQFTKRAHLLFGQWLSSDVDSREKEETMECLWEETPSVYTQRTQEKWEEIREQVYPTEPKRVYMLHFLIKYAAVILLMVMSGGVTYYFTEKGTTELEEITWQEFFVPYGESQSVLLSDGTTVSVGAGSLLVYPDKFTGTDRPVYLSGEATFTVTPNKEKPFFVKTRVLDVEVLGTSFTVGSYPGDTYTEVTLEKGSVKVDTKDLSEGKPILKPGEQLIYQHDDHSVSIHTIDMDLYKMSRKGYLIFKEIPFDQLITTLERKFNVTIHCDIQKYEDRKCNLKFAPDETIKDVLAVLQRLLHITYKVDGQVVYIN